VIHISERLDILVTQILPADPVVMLTASRMRRALDDLAASYDWIVIDCPPTLGLSDARLIGNLAGMVLLAARWDATPVSALKVSATELREAGVDMIGGVLNDVDLKRHQSYGYGSESAEAHYSKYKSYYHTA